jgi:hypothetical protein
MNGLVLFQVLRVPTTHEIMLPIWPMEDRPELYQNEAYINNFTVDTCLALKAAWESQLKKENRGESTFGKDAALPTRHYDAGPDNCADLLHPARLEYFKFLRGGNAYSNGFTF